MNLELALIQNLSKREPHVSSSSTPHVYFSEAGNCSRKISLRLSHSNDPRPETTYTRSLNSVLATKLGEFIHSQVQDSLLLVEPNLQVELVTKMGVASGRVDGYYLSSKELLDVSNNPIPPGTKIVVEIKSMSDTMFSRSNKASYPNLDHLTQAMIGAKSLDSAYVHLIYINKSPKTNTPAMLEWIIPLDLELVDMEMSRLQNILEDTENGIIAEPIYQGEIIDNPDKKFWPCGFCEYIRECKELGVTKPKSLPFNLF